MQATAGPAHGTGSRGRALTLPQATGVGQLGKGRCQICLWKGKEMNTDGRGQDLAEKAESIRGDQN